MNVIRDYYCEACGSVTRDVVGDVTQELPCDVCRCITSHRDMCNGARHSRFHFHDFGTVPLEAMCRYEGAGASEARTDAGLADYSRPVTDLNTGKAYQNDQKYSADARADRAARRKHAAEKRLGRGRIYAPTSGARKAN